MRASQRAEEGRGTIFRKASRGVDPDGHQYESESESATSPTRRDFGISAVSTKIEGRGDVLACSSPSLFRLHSFTFSSSKSRFPRDRISRRVNSIIAARVSSHFRVYRRTNVDINELGHNCISRLLACDPRALCSLARLSRDVRDRRVRHRLNSLVPIIVAAAVALAKFDVNAATFRQPFARRLMRVRRTHSHLSHNAGTRGAEGFASRYIIRVCDRR